jgi:hypothetical protein
MLQVLVSAVALMILSEEVKVRARAGAGCKGPLCGRDQLGQAVQNQC